MSSLDTSVSLVILFVYGAPEHLKLVVAKPCDELPKGFACPILNCPVRTDAYLEGLFSSQLFIQLENFNSLGNG